MRTLMRTAGVLSILLLAGMLSAAEPIKPMGARLIEPFDYRGVVLNDGPLLRQVLEVRDCYLGVPNDDYLKGFRKRAGKPAPGNGLGGCYTPGTFHVFGQVLSGLARMHAATGDEACRDKLNALIHEWSLCLEPDGYFYSTRPPDPLCGGTLPGSFHQSSAPSMAPASAGSAASSMTRARAR